jgi:hypothetical protein
MSYLHWNDPFVWVAIAAVIVIGAWSINERRK